MAPRRSRRFIPAIVLGLMALAIGIVIWRIAVGAGPTARPGGGPTVAVGSAYPMSYDVVYQETLNGVPLWEVLSVRRPLTGSDITYRSVGPPGPGAQPVSGNISTATGLYAVSEQGVQLVTGREPGPPSGDQNLAAELPELLRRGLANDASRTKTVAGRPCAVYRFFDPPSGPIPTAPKQGDHDDICLDADGLVLEETWTYNGKVATQRTAVDVRSSMQAGLDTSGLPVPSTEGAKPASGGAATLAPDPRPATFIATPAPPSGFQASGPALDFRLPDPKSHTQSAAITVVWAFTAGARVVTVEAGREQGAALPWQAGDTVTENVTLTRLGRATTAARSDGFELRVDLGGGNWVRVRGTVPLDQLIAYGHLLTHAEAAPTGG